ncbi:MAG: hypothetical protein V1918_08985 [Planctomycetota bacterium]
MASFPAKGVGLDEVLPANTILYARAFTYDRLKGGLQGTVLGKIAKQPEVAEFLELLNLRRGESIEALLHRTMRSRLVAEAVLRRDDAAIKALWQRHHEVLRTLLTKNENPVRMMVDAEYPGLSALLQGEDMEMEKRLGKYNDERSAPVDPPAFLNELRPIAEGLLSDYGAVVDGLLKEYQPVLDEILHAQVSLSFRGLSPESGGAVVDLGFALAHPPEEEALYTALRVLIQRIINPTIPAQMLTVSDKRVLVLPTPEKNHFALLGNLLVVTRDRAGLEEMIGHYQSPGAAPSLGKDPAFLAVMKGARVRPEDAFVFLNTARAIPVIRELTSPAVVDLISALGLPSVQAAGIGSNFQDEGLRQTIYLYAPAERSGLLRVFALGGGISNCAGAVPQDTDILLTARVSPAHLYREVPPLVDAVRKVLPSANRSGREVSLASLARERTILGVPAEEVLSALGDSVIFQSGPYGRVLRFDRADPAAFERVIARMEEKLGGAFASGPEGRIFYFNQSGYPLPLAPSYAILRGENTVLVATHPQVLKSYLREAGGLTLLENADFLRTTAGLPGASSLLAYVKAAPSCVSVYDAALPFLNALTALKPLAVDPGILPPGRELADYFFGFGVGVTNEPSGLTVTVYSPLGLGGPALYALDRVIQNPALVGISIGGLYQVFGLEVKASSPAVQP